MAAQKSPDWDSDVDSWNESEGTSSFELRKHDAESPALHVIRQKLVRRKDFPLPKGLGACEGSLELPHGS